MPKQDFDFIDYIGAVVVAVIFAIILAFLSFFVINFACITKYDDFTKFEKFGAKRNIRLGPHSLASVKNRKIIVVDDEEI